MLLCGAERRRLTASTTEHHDRPSPWSSPVAELCSAAGQHVPGHCLWAVRKKSQAKGQAHLHIELSRRGPGSEFFNQVGDWLSQVHLGSIEGRVKNARVVYQLAGRPPVEAGPLRFRKHGEGR